MKRLICTCLLALSIAQPSFGQDAVVADTLDWKRYYPLEIGNRWEYGPYGGSADHVKTIIGDTLAQGHHYFIRRDSTVAIGNVGPSARTNYVRLDSARTIVTVSNIEADTLNFPALWDGVIVNRDLMDYFDMQAAFGDSVVHGTADTLGYIIGGYNQELQIGVESVEVAAYKCFWGHESFLLSADCFAADIGLSFYGNLGGSDLKFARIGGTEYGVTIVSIEDKEVPKALGIESIYPNPMKESATIVYRLQKPSDLAIEVFNSLGQSLWREEMSALAAGVGRYQLHRQGWPAGLYFVRLSAEDGVQFVRSVIVG